jgi:hypothetical protein
MPLGKDEIDVLRGTSLNKLFNNKSLSTAAFFVALLVLVILSPKIFETNDAGYYKILQRPVIGTMKAFTSPGMFIQGFGDVFIYKASDIIYFSKHDNEGRNSDDSIEVRFNDGATAKVTGNVRIDLPLNSDSLIDIHKHFRSYDSLIKDTIKQVVAESTILTASLMTAEESCTTKRAQFSQLASDQLINGIYLTEAEQVAVKDPKTGEQVIKQVVRIKRDGKGLAERKESVLAKYSIKVGQFVVKDIDYEPTVAEQIKLKQQSIMQVVSAKANAEKAIQDRLTAEEVGRKNVAVAKYEQEVEKAKAVTSAEKELEVAKLQKLAAEQNKIAMILKAEGEGEYRRKLMVADGALDKKLATYEKVQGMWADAFAKHAHRLTPDIIMGGAANVASNAATQMMEFMGIKAAKDLMFTLSPKGIEANKK